MPHRNAAPTGARRAPSPVLLIRKAAAIVAVSAIFGAKALQGEAAIAGQAHANVDATRDIAAPATSTFYDSYFTEQP